MAGAIGGLGRAPARLPIPEPGAASPRREQVIGLLREAGVPRTIAQLAERMQVHPNTVRFHLTVLLRSGQVEQVSAGPSGAGRPPALFRATQRMDPAGPTSYRLLATILTEHLAATSPDPEAAAVELGREWGPRLLTGDDAGRTASSPVRRGEAVRRMSDGLRKVGFAPEPVTGPRDATIRLRHCPFLGVVTGGSAGGQGRRSVICSLHLGLMQGALSALRAPVTVDRLEPFVEPDLCVAHLTPAAGPSPSGPLR